MVDNFLVDLKFHCSGDDNISFNFPEVVLGDMVNTFEFVVDEFEAFVVLIIFFDIIKCVMFVEFFG